MRGIEGLNPNNYRICHYGGNKDNEELPLFLKTLLMGGMMMAAWEVNCKCVAANT